MNFFELPTGKMHFHTFSCYIKWFNDESMKLLIATSEHHPPWNWQLERWTTAKVMDLLLKHLWRKSGSRFKFFRALSIHSIIVYFSQATFWILNQVLQVGTSFLLFVGLRGHHIRLFRSIMDALWSPGVPVGSLQTNFIKDFQMLEMLLGLKRSGCLQRLHLAQRLFGDCIRTYRQKSKVHPLWSSKSRACTCRSQLDFDLLPHKPHASYRQGTWHMARNNHQCCIWDQEGSELWP